jgi:hypothetical protein
MFGKLPSVNSPVEYEFRTTIPLGEARGRIYLLACPIHLRRSALLRLSGWGLKYKPSLSAIGLVRLVVSLRGFTYLQDAGPSAIGFSLHLQIDVRSG